MAVEEIELRHRNPLLAEETAGSHPIQKYSNGSYKVEFKGEELTILSKNWRESLRLKLQILLSLYILINIGMVDQTMGALLPSLVNYYNTTQSKVSSVFLVSFAGYIISALSNQYVHVKYGRRGVLVIGTGLYMLGLFIESTRPPLLIFNLTYGFLGLGSGLLGGALNVHISALDDHNELMGVLHGFYGIGSMISPPLASFVLKIYNGDDDSKGGSGNQFFILGSIASLSFLLSAFIFRNETSLKYEYSTTIETKNESSSHDIEDNNQQYDASFIHLLKNRFIQLFSAYLFFYVGIEVGFGAWLLSYLIKVKLMDRISSSFSVSCFWAGLSIGRIALGFTTRYFKNEYRANKWYAVASLVLSILYGLFLLLSFPNTDASGVMGQTRFKLLNKLLILIFGVFVGPLYPTSNVTLTKVLPKYLHVSSIGIYSSIGGSGGAVLPFVIGLLIKWTSFSFFPLYISLGVATYVVLWLAIPKVCQVQYTF